jgi:hypothetical protein
VRVHGVPASLDEMLGKISEIQHAA